jgi:signal transduction histidine kinase/ligand-binding sensor domain-containing protein/DNA-binding response OmpR family regulator
VALYAFLFPLAGQNDIHFDHYSIDDGLSNSRVRSFIHDDKGFIWVGTADGLNRFDSYDFTVFRSDDQDSIGLLHSGIPALLEDRKGNMWVGSKIGLQLMNRKKQQCFPLKSDEVASLGGIKHVLHLIESSNGDIWAGAVNGLFRIKTATQLQNLEDLLKADQASTFTVEVFKPNGVEADDQNGNWIWNIEEGEEGLIWIGTNAGLACFDVQNNKFIPLPITYNQGIEDVFSTPVQALATSAQGILWVGTEKGLFKLDTERKTCARFNGKTSVGITPENEFITELVVDKRGHLWIGTDGSGIFRWSEKEQTLYQYKNDLLNSNSLIDNNIESLYLDREEGLWIGTHKGISYYSPHGKPFEIIRAGMEENAIRQGTIEDIDVDGDWIWLAIDDGGLSKYHMQTGEVESFTSAESSNGLTSNDVVTVLMDRKRRLWIGSWGGGISRLSADGLFYHFLSDETLSEPLRDAYIWTLFESKTGDIWIGTVNHGLIQYQTEQDEFHLLGGRGKEATVIPGTWVIAIEEDANGLIWIVTNKGVFTYDPELKKANEAALPISSEEASIMSLQSTPDGGMWLGSQKGLIYHSVDTSYVLTVSDGLAVNWVRTIERDHHGNLWIGTTKGISKYEPQNNTFKHYESTDGLPMGEFSRASCKMADGKMLFGNINGLVAFHPDSIKLYEAAPSVVITKFLLFNEAISTYQDSETPHDPTDFILSEHISYSREIRLEHWQNYIAFEFSALDYLNATGNKYKYRLKGLQEDWVSTNADYRVASFTDLSPGDYVLQVMAGNADGVWSVQPTELNIYIAYPWWRTWWAYVLYSLLVLGSVLAALRIFKYRLTLQAQLDFNQREAQRLKELDEFKSRLYTNLTHEFRTPLTVILGMAEQIRMAPKQYLKQGTQLIENNGRSLLRLINQLLDLSKLEGNTLQLRMIQADVISYLRYITASFQTYANSRNLSLRFFAQPETLHMDYDPDQLQQIMYNLISNAVKFTPSGGEVVVRIQQEQNILRIKVQDNGVGIAKAAQALIFDRFYQVSANPEQEHIRKVAGTGIGLAHTRELVKLMKGQIEVESELNKGTVFTVSLPIEQNAPLRKVAPGETWKPPVEVDHNGTEETASEKPLLLIIEDNPDVVLYLKSCLNEAYQLDIAYNGKIGIEKAVEQIPDLIISDIMMPEKDGYEVCDFLKQDERTSHIPVILLTAKADTDSRIAGLKRGADAYLSKPFNKQELLVRLEKLVERQQRMAAYFEKRTRNTDELDLPQPVEQEALEIEDAFIQKVRLIIAEQYEDEHFALPELCTQLGMSRSQLYRKMKALTNTTPSAYIRFYRLNTAKSLLQKGEFTVAEVAWKVGYKDAAHFSKSFLDEFGCSPSELIK